MKILFILLLLFKHLLLAQEKHLILAEGNGWYPHMAKNLIKNHSAISQLPFSGFIVVGNSFTDLVMQKNTKLSYEKVWQELKDLKGLYTNQPHNFLQINIQFPGDFWNNQIWEQVSKNFSIVAKVAKELGFKGIVFDDEPYNLSAKKMVNYKFPSIVAIQRKPNHYTIWQKKRAEPKWVDTYAYSNKKYTFLEHMQQVSLRFKNIMLSMTKVFPNLVTLVYLGPSLSHENSNKNYPIVIDMGLPRENEYHGPIFLGFKQGLRDKAQLHDMGESYKYRKNKHFGYAYQWRKYDIAKDQYNDTLDPQTHWIIPKKERFSWSNKIKVGFMVFNKGQKSSYDEFTTLNNSTVHDIERTLKKALKYTDEYVIFYPEEQDWLLPNQEHPLPLEWMEMMKRVYKYKQLL